MEEQPVPPTAKNPFFGMKIDPLRVAAVMLAACAVFCALSKLADSLGVGMGDVLVPWTFALSFLLLYAVAGALFILTSTSELRYFGRAIYAFMGLALGNGLVARLFSGIPIGEAGSYKKLYLVVAIGFLVFVSIVSAMKGIVRFAQREEWERPRHR